MSSPLRIELRASRALPIALVLLALGAGAALWMSSAGQPPADVWNLQPEIYNPASQRAATG